MDDLISRLNLIMTLTVTAEETAQMKVGDLKKVINVINNQPSAQQWIPCTDRTPRMGERVVVTSVHHKTEAVVVDVLRYHGEKYGWGIEDIGTVVAWMPLPEPYKEGDE